MTETPTTKKTVVKLESLKANLQKERDGDWVPDKLIGPDVAFLVRSTNYAPFRIARDAVNAKLQRKYKDEPVPDEVSAKAYGELAVEHLLLDWRGIDVEFTPEVASEVLTDEAYRSFRSAVYFAATKSGQGEIEFVEETIKNSGTPSATK